MVGIEKSQIEQDPGYDPESLAGSAERREILRDDTTTSQEISPVKRALQLHVSIPEYTFTDGRNPYKFDAEPHLTLERIATPIDRLLEENFSDRKILVRAVQSAKHDDMIRERFIKFIIDHGLDYIIAPDDSFYAAEFLPFSKGSSVLGTLEGFHKWKPKSEEIPQDIADIWMVFDAEQYEAMSHTHPRHKTLSKDKYRLKQGYLQWESLLAVIVVN